MMHNNKFTFFASFTPHENQFGDLLIFSTHCLCLTDNNGLDITLQSAHLFPIVIWTALRHIFPLLKVTTFS